MQLVAKKLKQTKCPKCGESVDTRDGRILQAIKCPACGSDVTVSASFGDFVLYEMLGRGTSGTVFRALDQKLQRQVALKVLHSGGAHESMALECVREARALAALDHDGIVRIFSIGEFRGQHFIVMELVTGGTAEGMINPHRPVEQSRVLEMAVTLVGGLEAAQKVGLTHMDVKPGNILIGKEGVPKLIDFGAAQYAQQRKDGGVVGTPYYIAPEVACGHDGTFKSDMYSLGATLFHLVTGKPPFQAGNNLELIRARLKAPAPSIRDIQPNLHRRLEKVIGRMLEKKPSDRYHNYQQLYDELVEAQESVKRDTAGIDPIRDNRPDDPAAILAEQSEGMRGMAFPQPNKPPTPSTVAQAALERSSLEQSGVGTRRQPSSGNTPVMMITGMIALIGLLIGVIFVLVNRDTTPAPQPNTTPPSNVSNNAPPPRNTTPPPSYSTPPRSTNRTPTPTPTVTPTPAPVAAAQPVGVCISEIMYNPASSESVPNRVEWIEIYNPTGQRVSLAGWHLHDEDGRTTGLPDDAALEPGEAGVFIPADVTVAEFRAAWGDGFKAWPVDGWGRPGISGLANSPSPGNERLHLSDGAGNLMDEVAFDDEGDWPRDEPDGPSIYLKPGAVSAADNDRGTNWARSVAGAHGARASTPGGPFGSDDVGSPGHVER